MILTFRENGAIGVATITIIGPDTDTILNYALKHNLELMLSGPANDKTINLCNGENHAE